MKDKVRYERMKYIIESKNEQNKITRLSSIINSKIWLEKIDTASNFKMESYCLKCKKYTENINLQVSSTSNGKVMILSKCAICNSKKSKFINKQEANWLLSKLGIKTPFSKWPILGDVLFWMHIKMNEIVDNFP